MATAKANPVRDGIEKNIRKLKMTRDRQEQALADTVAQIAALEAILKTL